jgi:hypothetical protein
MSNTTWNPRYVLYAQHHGRTPEEQLEWDRALWPGGMMSGFSLWIEQRKQEFRGIHPEACLDSGIIDIHAWDEYLKSFVKGAKRDN